LIREIMARHPGGVGVSLELTVEGKRVSIRAGEKLKVNPGNGFIEEMEDLAGIKGVRFVTPFRRAEAALVYDGEEELLPED